MSIVNQSLQISAPVTQIPYHIDEWLYDNIDGDVKKVEQLMRSGEIGVGHHSLGNGSPIDDRCFKIYASDSGKDIRIYWNDGTKIIFCHVTLEYTRKRNRYDDEAYSEFFGYC